MCAVPGPPPSMLPHAGPSPAPAGQLDCCEAYIKKSQATVQRADSSGGCRRLQRSSSASSLAGELGRGRAGVDHPCMHQSQGIVGRGAWC